jgi:4-hydroxy-tetrahydrodipicolinate synthase
MLITAPFGRLMTAMVTPFTADGSIDWDGVAGLAHHLADHGHDAIAVNGTTGEAPTTKSSEKLEIIKVVKNAVGSRVKVLSGAGDNETSYTVEQAKRSADAGADGLLIVAPYYNKPPQAGIEAHFKAVAAATDLPIMMYDIPGRTGVEIESDTIMRLFELPNIVALKDAKGNLAATSDVIARSGIPVEIHQKLIPVFKGTFRTQGAILTKAAMNLMGLPGGTTRLPLVDATPAQIATLREDLIAGGVQLG